MAEARGRDAWQHTSCILALIANVNRDPKKTRAFRPDDFNPFSGRRRGVPLRADNLRVLKDLFTKRGRK